MANKSTNTAVRTPAFPSSRGDERELYDITASELDALDLDHLFEVYNGAFSGEDIQHGKTTLINFMTRLDRVYCAKLARLFRKQNSDGVLAQLRDHLQRVSSDVFFDSASLPRECAGFGARWKTLCDLVSAIVDETEHDHAIATGYSDLPFPSNWQWVSQQLRAAGGSMAWSALFDALQCTHANVSTRSRSGLSNLVNSMRLAGQVTVVADGRTKRVALISRATVPTIASVTTLPLVAPPASPVVSSKVTGMLRAVTCNNQGNFLDFLLCSSERHKKLATVKSASVRDAYTHDVSAFDEFAAYLHCTVKGAMDRNLSVLSSYFEIGNRASCLPRLCVKVVDRINGDLVVRDFARDHTASYSSGPIKIDDNTGFVDVQSTGRFVIFNDLEKDVLDERYRNPRIDREKVSSYLESASRVDGASLSPAVWRSFWKQDGKSTDDARSVYRSTAIIPITLLNNAMSAEFKEVMGEKNEAYADASYDRAILGYLCLDHPQANYFMSDVDMDVGYAVADWMSLYIFVRYMYTNMSERFTRGTTKFAVGSQQRNRLRELLIERAATCSSEGFVRIDDGRSMSKRNFPLVTDFIAQLTEERHPY